MGAFFLFSLDEFTGTEIFVDLYQKYVHAHSFPDMRSTWEDLGIETRHEQVSLTQSAPLADVREAIMMSLSTEDALTFSEEMVVEDE